MSGLDLGLDELFILYYASFYLSTASADMTVILNHLVARIAHSHGHRIDRKTVIDYSIKMVTHYSDKYGDFLYTPKECEEIIILQSLFENDVNHSSYRLSLYAYLDTYYKREDDLLIMNIILNHNHEACTHNPPPISIKGSTQYRSPMMMLPKSCSCKRHRALKSSSTKSAKKKKTVTIIDPKDEKRDAATQEALALMDFRKQEVALRKHPWQTTIEQLYSVIGPKRYLQQFTSAMQETEDHGSDFLMRTSYPANANLYRVAVEQAPIAIMTTTILLTNRTLIKESRCRLYKKYSLLSRKLKSHVAHDMTTELVDIFDRECTDTTVSLLPADIRVMERHMTDISTVVLDTPEALEYQDTLTFNVRLQMPYRPVKSILKRHSRPIDPLRLHSDTGCRVKTDPTYHKTPAFYWRKEDNVWQDAYHNRVYSNRYRNDLMGWNDEVLINWWVMKQRLQHWGDKFIKSNRQDSEKPYGKETKGAIIPKEVVIPEPEAEETPVVGIRERLQHWVADRDRSDLRTPWRLVTSLQDVVEDHLEARKDRVWAEKMAATVVIKKKRKKKVRFLDIAIILLAVDDITHEFPHTSKKNINMRYRYLR